MRKTKLAAFVLCAVAAVSDAYAMDLSLNDAVDMIMAESQDLKKAEANVKKAEASLDVANANRWFQIEGTATYMNLIDVKNPTKSYSVSIPPEIGGMLQQYVGPDFQLPSKIDIPDSMFMAGVSITQPIYTFGKIGNAVKGVKAAIKVAEASQEMTRREIRYSAVDMYWTAKMTDEIVDISRADLDAARAARRSLTSAGRANRSNLVKIESDIATKEINLSNAEFNRDTAHRMLKILAGIDMDTELNLTYNYIAMGPNISNMFSRNDMQSGYWGLALQVPIFSGGVNMANATVEAMNAEAARQDLDKAKKMTTEEYNRAIDQYNHLRGNLKTLENARDLAAKAYDFSSERFASGQTSAVELSEVSAGLYQLDMSLLNAKYNILMSAESVKKLGE